MTPVLYSASYERRSRNHTTAVCIITGLYPSGVGVGKRDMTQKGFSFLKCELIIYFSDSATSQSPERRLSPRIRSWCISMTNPEVQDTLGSQPVHHPSNFAWPSVRETGKHALLADDQGHVCVRDKITRTSKRVFLGSAVTRRPGDEGYVPFCTGFTS